MSLRSYDPVTVLCGVLALTIEVLETESAILTNCLRPLRKSKDHTTQQHVRAFHSQQTCSTLHCDH